MEITGLSKLWGYIAAAGAVLAVFVAVYFKARSDGAHAVVADEQQKRADNAAKIIEVQANVGQLSDPAVTDSLRAFQRD